MCVQTLERSTQLKPTDIMPTEYANTDVRIESNFACAPTPECEDHVVMYELYTPAGERIECVITTRDRSVFNAFASQQRELLTKIPMTTVEAQLSDTDLQLLQAVCEMQLDIKRLAPAQYAHETLTRDQDAREQLSSLLSFGISCAYNEWAEIHHELTHEHTYEVKVDGALDKLLSNLRDLMVAKKAYTTPPSIETLLHDIIDDATQVWYDRESQAES